MPNKNILQTERNQVSYKNGSIYSENYFLKGIFKRYLEAKAELAFVRSHFNLGLQNTLGIFPMLWDEKKDY